MAVSKKASEKKGGKTPAAKSKATPAAAPSPKDFVKSTESISAPSKNWIVPLVLVAIAVLVVVEMATLLKGKAARQRQLTQVSAFGERGGQPRPQAYNGAIAMKTDATDHLFLVDPDWAKVLVYDTKQSKFLFALDKIAAGQEDYAPADVAADGQNAIYVLDRAHQRMYVFSYEGRLLRQWVATFGSDVALNKDGEIIVSDNNRMQIVRYTPEGKEIKRFGSAGGGKGQLNNPARLDTDAQNNIYVIDSGNKRIQVFSQEGHPKASWALKFTPTVVLGVSVHGQEVYVNDFENSYLWVYSLRGKLVGQIKSTFPATFAIDSQKNFYIPTANADGAIGRFIQARAGK